MKEKNNVSISIIKNTFKWLAGMTGITFLVAFFLKGIILPTFVFWGSFIVILGIIITFGFIKDKASYKTLAILAIIFALLEGIGISTLVSHYNIQSLIGAFLGASIFFILMSLWGYNTPKDLSSWGKYLLLSLISIIIASIVNIFFFNLEVLDIVISIIALIVFLGFTAFDLQSLKKESKSGNRKLEVSYGISLYLNFINLFSSLLNLFGED